MVKCPICKESCIEGASTKGRIRGSIVCENENYVHTVTKSGLNILTRTILNIGNEIDESSPGIEKYMATFH